MAKIKEMFNLVKGSLQSSKCTPGEYNFITASKDWKTHNEFEYDCEALIFAAAASGSLGRTHYVNGKFISSDLCFIITPKNEIKYPIDLKFYHIIFNTLKEDIVKNTKAGTSKEAIGLKALGEYDLPYIDIDKQREISSKFNFATQISESFDTEITHQLDLIKNLRQAFLREAMQGVLVNNETSDHKTGADLLAEIQAEKAQLVKDKKIKKPKPLAPITEEDIPFVIPENWTWCRLGEISEIGTGATPLTSNSEYYINADIPWMTSSETSDLFVYKTEKFITKKAIEETNCKIYPVNTLVIAMYGQGKTRGQITELKIEAATNQACATINIYKYNQNFNSYIKYYFLKIYDEIRLLAQGGAQPNLNMDKIRNTIISLPPLEIQERIVAKLDELMGYCDALEEQAKQSQQTNELLLQQVLREALGA